MTIRPASHTALHHILSLAALTSCLALLTACPTETLNVGDGDVDMEDDVGVDAPDSDAGADTGVDSGPDIPDNMWQPLTLEPVDEWTEADYIPRARPKSVELSADEQTVFVALPGNLIDPMNVVVAVDAATGTERGRATVGSSPQGMQLSNDGSVLYVACQFSNYLSVVSATTYQEVGRIPVSFYAQDIAINTGGNELYVSNRWLDAVEVVALDSINGTSGQVTRTIVTGTNPRDVVLAESGTLYVGNLAETSISVIDPAAGAELRRIYLNSPVNGLATSGPLLFVATLGRGDGHPKNPGLTDGVPYRGDSTASLGFADINNDVVVINTTSHGILQRYTSDTAEVSHEDEEGDYLPSELLVEGALPEQVVARGNRACFTMSASDQVQCFTADMVTGQLTPVGVYDTGLNPFEIAMSSTGNVLWVANRLGETVSRIETAGGTKVDWPIGLVSPPYPSSEYEIGEMLFHTSDFSSEALPSAVFPAGDKSGDKSCNHCHRETLTDGKVWSVGIDAVVPLGGQRMPPAARNIRDTLPLFWEGVQQPEDFDLESNEFSPLDDFEGETEEELEAARDAFFIRQVGFDFDTVARDLIGKFLVGRPRLLPNPDQQFATGERAASIERGRTLFVDRECSACHPNGGDPTMPFTSNMTIPPVITISPLDTGYLVQPFEIDDQFNIPSIRGVWDRPRIFFHDGRGKSLRSAILGPNHPALVDGVDGCFILAEEVDTHGPIFRPVYNGRGCNEVSGQMDTHGVTSDLSAAQVEDLLNYVRSIE